MGDHDHNLDSGELARLPLFPLPNVVFFPGTDLPLHVFEPRYRDLVTHCLDSGGAMGVVLLRSGYEEDYLGRPPVHEVLGAGRIVDSEQLPDGRWNIVVRGTDRVRIVEEWPPDTAFRLARCERLADREEGRRPDCEDTLRKLVMRLTALVPDVKAPLTRLLESGCRGIDLADQLACRLIPDPVRRQRILEELDACRRANMVMEEVAEVCLRVDPCDKNRGPVN